MSTKISWTDETWNPIIGCSHVSPGCDNCYAERMGGRIANMWLGNYEYVMVTGGPNDPLKGFFKGKWNGKTHFVESALEKPSRWKKPQKIFVCSMSDLFHETIPFEWIDKVMEIIWRNPEHIFQVLTKRPQRAFLYFQTRAHEIKRRGLDSVPTQSNNIFDYYHFPKNMWLGVTVENQRMAERRIPILLQIPAKTRFVSAEPLLGPLDILKWLIPGADGLPREMDEYHDWIDWVIVGGESGSNARPMHPHWVRSLRDQCEKVGIPFFFKQWGEWGYIDRPQDQSNVKSLNKNERWLNIEGGHGFHGENVCRMRRMGKKTTGSLLDDVEHKKFPKTNSNEKA